VTASKRSTSLRSAQRKVAARKSEIAELERSYTRATRGQKAAITKKLKATRNSLRAYRGVVTKKRNVQTARKGLSTAKRRAAARKGWEKRRASPARVPAALASESDQTMPFLVPPVIRVWPPDSSDRSMVARYWNPVILSFLENGSTVSLEAFKGKSIFDEISDQRLYFVTDPQVILEHVDSFTLFFEQSFYKRREEAA
jgi:hypothetical protein